MTAPVNQRSTRSRRHRRGTTALKVITALATVVGTYTVSQQAEAKIPRVLRPGTRALYFNLGFGGSVGLGRGYYNGAYNGGYGYGYLGGFRLTSEFGGHFKGAAEGPALGVLFEQEFYGYGGFGLILAPKFVYDIQIIKNLGFYISPSIAAGYHMYTYFDYGARYGRLYGHTLDVQVAVAAKLMLDDRWLVWVNFPNFDLNFGRYNNFAWYGGRAFYGRLLFMIGGGVTFG